MQKCSADCWWCVYVWPWKVWKLELSHLWRKHCLRVCAFALIFMWKSCTCTWNTNWFISAYNGFVLHVMQGHPVASSMPASACSPSSSVLEKPSQTAVAKGGCVCENTHLSPADGSFSGHTVLPARLASRAWPSPQPAQQATGITSPCWQDPFYGLRVRNTSSNAGEYPVSPYCFGPFNPPQTRQFVIYLLRQCKNSPRWLFLPLFCLVSNASRQLSNGELVNWDGTVCGWCWNGQPAWHSVFPDSLHTHTRADSCACASCLPAKAMCFPPVWCGEMSIAVAFKRFKNQTLLCCRRIFSTIPPGAPDKFRCEAFTPKTSITSTC